MGTSKWYNVVPVKDCTLFAPTSLIFGPGLSDGVI